MRLFPVSYNGFLLNDMVNTASEFEDPHMWSTHNVSPNYLPRANRFPVYGNKKFTDRVFSIRLALIGVYPPSVIDSMKLKINPYENNTFDFIARDNDTGMLYTLDCASVSVINEDRDARIWTLTFSAGDPVWKSVRTFTYSESVTLSGTEITVDNTGNYPCNPVIKLYPTSLRSGGFGYSRYVKIINRTSNQLTRYPFDITEGGIDTATLITAGKMEANCTDLRVFVDGVEVHRWLDDPDTANTKIWVNLDMVPRMSWTLKTAITSGTAPSVIEVNRASWKSGRTTYYALTGVPVQGVLNIDDELFTYTSIDVLTGKFTGVTRSYQGTTAANHSINATIDRIEHDVMVFYGDETLTTYTESTSDKPVLDLENSSNTSWVYDVFKDNALQRSAIFRNSVLYSSGGQSLTYSAPSEEDADPATAMGMSGLNWQSGSKWMSEKYQLEWRLRVPSGITHVAASGYKKKSFSDTTAPVYFGLQSSLDGNSWKNVWSETNPTSVTNTAWSRTATALSATRQYIRFYINGTLPTTANSRYDYEIGEVTLTLASATIPDATWLSEISQYYMDMTITNETTGDILYITGQIANSDTLIVDMENKEIYQSLDGINKLSILSLGSVRMDWLSLSPGNNVIKFEEEGLVNLLVTFEYQRRMT